MKPESVPSFGPSQLLRLSSDPARIVMGLFVVSNFIYAIATLDDVKHAAPVLVAAVIVNVGAVMLVLDMPDPFPARETVTILVIVLVSTLLVAFQLPDTGHPGRASWHLGSNTWLLFFLAMRGRVGSAWLGYGLMAAATIEWSVSSGRGAGEGLLLLDTHAAILFVATMFGLNLRRTSRQITGFDKLSVGTAVEAAEAATSAQIRQKRVVELRASTEPLLRRIIDEGPPLDPQERLAYATAEAILRDGVRGRSLVTPRISEATMAARSRGVDVMLLDDRGKALDSGEAMTRLGDAVVSVLGEAQDGTVTVRLGPAGRAVAVSIVTSGDGATSRVDLDAEGKPVARQ